MAIEKDEAAKRKGVVPNFADLKNTENAFLFKAVKVKKQKAEVRFKHPDEKTISNLIDELLKIDAKLLEKLS